MSGTVSYFELFPPFQRLLIAQSMISTRTCLLLSLHYVGQSLDLRGFLSHTLIHTRIVRFKRALKIVFISTSDTQRCIISRRIRAISFELVWKWLKINHDKLISLIVKKNGNNCIREREKITFLKTRHRIIYSAFLVFWIYLFLYLIFKCILCANSQNFYIYLKSRF